MTVTVRDAGVADAAFLAEMLVAAFCWRDEVPRLSVAGALADPPIAHYVAGWPRPGDAGVVAEDGSEPVGAAWWRFLAPDDPGFGFVDASIPEITLGVRAQWRRQGIGTRLMQALIERAKGIALAALSLSVEPDNGALGLYERLGCRAVGRSGGSLTMTLEVP
ncbi:MAG: GNAT family N-acetyltransferase [Frankiaceae bacterium]